MKRYGPPVSRVCRGRRSAVPVQSENQHVQIWGACEMEANEATGLVAPCAARA